MKNIKLKLAVLFSISVFINATDYDNAKFENYVSGQGVNDVIAEAQLIVCKLSKLGTKELAGDGSYKATIFADECEETGGSGDSSQGTSAPSSAQSGGSSSSSSSGADQASNIQKEIETVFINTGFLSATTQTTKAWVINDKPWDEETNREPKNIVYLLNEQTQPADETSKFGKFTLRFQASTYGNKQADLPEWYQCPPENSREYKHSWCSDGADLGRGLLIADGGLIKFKSELQSSEQQNMVAEYSENGDIAGVYSKQTGFQDESLRDPNCDGAEDWWECQPQAYKDSNTSILGIFAFGISTTDKTYCTKMSELYKVDWSVYDEENDGPTLTPYTLSGQPLQRLGNEGWDVNEKCFSIDKDDAITNVFDYGVFNEDGSSLNLENQSFPITTTVTVNEVDRKAHGYASYWGVHVQDEYQDLVDASTVWTKDNDADSTDTFKVLPRKLQVRKSEKKFVALNELDGLSLNFWTNDSWWSEQYQKLGFAAIDPYEGKLQFKSSKAVLTDYNNGSSSDPLTYSLYGYHNGADAYIVDLVGAKLDKDNLTKIIDNDPSDPGKAMNLTMEFSDFPDYSNYPDGVRETYIGIILCTGSSIDYTRRTPYDAGNVNIKSDQMCMSVSGHLDQESDGTTMTLSTRSKSNNGSYNAMFYDGATGTRLYFDQDNWNNSGYEYDFIVQKTGIERPAGMEIMLSQLLTAFGGLSQMDDNGGDISRGLKSFLNSSDTFTFNVTRYEDMYDHLGQPFNNIYGTFSISSDPTAAVFVDDVKTTEPSDAGAAPSAETINVTLSKAQASAVTFDYAVSSSSTATAGEDFETISAGTVTIPAGSTTGSIPFTQIADVVAEGLTDEVIILDLTNPTNAVLGRTSSKVYIYDNDTNRIVYDDYSGTYDSETQTFTVTEGLKFNPTYSKTTLPAPIKFTNTDWLTHMQKTYDPGEEWERTEYKELNVWSSDTDSSYTIKKNSFQNPTSGTTENGVSTIEDSIVPASELPAELWCIERCITSSGINAHYQNAKDQADPAGDATYTGSISSASPSPIASTGPFIKEDMTVTTIYNEGTEDQYTESRDYRKGEWVDSVVASEMYKYTAANGAVQDADGNELAITVDWGTSRPEEKLRNAGGSYYETLDGWRNETQWGTGSWDLVDTATLAYLECTYTTDDNGNKIYNNENPQYTTANGKASETRYCASRRWESNEILVRYSIEVQTYPNYEIFDSSGANVVFNPPKRLYFAVPDDSATYGNDAGKKFQLDYQGDHLGGIPGSVIDIETGVNYGEYVTEWKDTYRWVPRFTIPDGTLLTENTSDNKYKVKKLRGEEWLGKKDSAIGSLASLLTSKTKADLLTNRDLRFEVSVREEQWWQCSLKKTVTYTDGDGNTFEEEETDWDLCYSEQYIDDESVWILDRSFEDCNGVIQWEKDRITSWIEEDIARAAENGEEYTGPTTWEEYIAENPENWEYLTQRIEECKTIGDIPTTLINGGEPSVVNGEIVFDPTPSQ
jgi:hypothetical protein